VGGGRRCGKDVRGWRGANIVYTCM
jgi:hypothetical protein